MPSPIYQYVVNLVMSLPIRRSPCALMNVSVREHRTHTQINITSPLNAKIITYCVQISVLSPMPDKGNKIRSLVYIRPRPATFSRPDIQSVGDEIQTAHLQREKYVRQGRITLRRNFFWTCTL